MAALVQANILVEVNDTYGHRYILEPGQICPSTGTTYEYTIIGYFSTDVNDYVWEACIKEYSESGSIIYDNRVIRTKSYVSRDLQAMTETSSTSICINGTHFWSLSYWDGRGFPLWDRHIPVCYSPYHLVEVSDYEFYAYGGS